MAGFQLSINGRFWVSTEDEFLNEHWFATIAEAQVLAEAWRVDYNTVRPHSSLGYRTPAEYIHDHEGLAGDAAGSP